MLNFPQNWKDDPKYWQPLAKAVAGISFRPSDTVLDGYKRWAERNIERLFDRSISLESVVQRAASGGGLNKDAPSATFGIVEILGKLSPLLDEEGKKILNTKKNEAQRLLVEYGKTGAMNAENLINAVAEGKSEGIDPTLAQTVLNNFEKDISQRRKLLDVESNVRQGRSLAPSDIETLGFYNIDPSRGDVLTAINQAITKTPGLRDIRTNLDEVSLGNEIKDAAGKRDFSSSVPFSEIEKIASETGVRAERLEEMKRNIQGFLSKTPNATTEEARNWALQGKNPGSDEANAVNSLLERVFSGKAVALNQPKTASPATASTPEQLTTDLAKKEEPLEKVVSASTIAAPTSLDDKIKSANAKIDESDLPAETKNLFKAVIRNWDLNTEINFENVINEFKKIEKQTIDPSYAEKVNAFTRDLVLAKQQEEQRRALEREEEEQILGERERAAKASLEARGLTFSGKAIDELGEQSAFARQGSPEAEISKIPLQIPFGGDFIEGSLPKSARLLRSSSLARNRAILEQLGARAEEALGTEEALRLGIPFTPVSGGIKTGKIKEARNIEAGQALQQIANQQRQNIEYQRPAII